MPKTENKILHQVETIVLILYLADMFCSAAGLAGDKVGIIFSMICTTGIVVVTLLLIALIKKIEVKK